MFTKPIGHLYADLQKTPYWKNYYKWFGDPFLHYHLCYAYLKRELLNLSQKTKVIDWGCGDGTYINHLAHDFNVEGIGIDNRPDRLQKAQEIAAIHNINTNFINLDITSPNLFVGEFEVATCFDVIEHIKPADVEAVFKNIATSLTEGGLFILRVPHEKDQKYLNKSSQQFFYGDDHHEKPGYTHEELNILLSKYNFKVEKIIYNYYWLAQIVYEISERIRSKSKFAYSIFSAIFRYLDYIEINSHLLSFSRANGILIVARKSI